MKKRHQRARPPEEPYQSPSSEDDQVTDDATSPLAPNPKNNNEVSTQNKSDTSSNDPNDNPQAKVNPKILDPTKEYELQQLESKLKDMEMETESLPVMSSVLENIQKILALMQTTSNIPTPNLDTQPHKYVSDTSDEEGNAHQMRCLNKTTKSEASKKNTMNHI